jgi:hypothetical protein
VTRPALHKIKISDIVLGRGVLLFTMSVGQWDMLLQAGYDGGSYILELDDNEIPVAAYQKPKPDVQTVRQE